MPDLSDHPAGSSYVVASFADAATARAAMEGLRQFGFDPASIELVGGDAPPASRVAQNRDAPVLKSVFWQILLWGVLGAVIGGLMGVAFVAAGIGPGGTTGAGLQIAGWAMFAHIIASLWAGYLVLGTRSTRDLTWQPERQGRVLVRVRCHSPEAAADAEARLRVAGAASVAAHAG